MSPSRTGLADRPARAAPGRRPEGRVSIDPRIRQRREEVTRGLGRRRRRMVVALLVVVALGVGSWFLLHGSLFSARVLRVVGSVHTPAASILAAAGLSTHPPLVDVDPGAAAARVERLPWVATARVQRQWPDGVVVTVDERTPVAVVAAGPAPGGGWAEVDRTGRVLADVPVPPPHLVRLTSTAGTVPAPPAPGGDLGPSERGALKVAATLPPAFASQVTAVVAEQGGTVGLQLTTPVTVELGSTSQLHAKYEDVAAFLAGASLVAGDRIDVSVPESPWVLRG